MKRSKAKSYDAHSKQRAEERYDISLNKHDIGAIVKLIQNGKFQCRQQTNDRSVCTGCYKEQPIKVIYAKRLKRLVTVLPLRPKQKPPT